VYEERENAGRVWMFILQRSVVKTPASDQCAIDIFLRVPLIIASCPRNAKLDAFRRAVENMCQYFHPDVTLNVL